MATEDDEQSLSNERKKDSTLKDQLQQEASGIFAWMVRGCLEWQKQGLNAPGCVRLATSDYKQEQDTFSQFASTCLYESPEASVGAGDSYNVYKRWAEDIGLTPMSPKGFGMRMGERYKKVAGRTGNSYIGVGLCAPAEPEAASTTRMSPVEGVDSVEAGLETFQEKSPTLKESYDKLSTPSTLSTADGATSVASTSYLEGATGRPAVPTNADNIPYSPHGTCHVPAS